MFSAGSGGKGGAAVAGQPAAGAHLDYAAGHAQFRRLDPAPSGSYAVQADYDHVQDGAYAPPGYAEYRDHVPSSSSGSEFDHSRYAVASHANLSHAPRQPSSGYPSYAVPYQSPADPQTMRDQAAWAQGGPSPRLGAYTFLPGGNSRVAYRYKTNPADRYTETVVAPEMPPNRKPNPPSSRLPAGSTYLDQQPGHAHPPTQQLYRPYGDHLEPNEPARAQPAVAQCEDGRSLAAMSSWRPAEEPLRGFARNQPGPGFTVNGRQEPAVPRQRYSTIPEENNRSAPRQDFTHPRAPTSPLKPTSARSESAERSFQCVQNKISTLSRPTDRCPFADIERTSSARISWTTSQEPASILPHQRSSPRPDLSRTATLEQGSCFSRRRPPARLLRCRGRLPTPVILRRIQPSIMEDSPILRTFRRTRLDLRPVAMLKVNQKMERLRVRPRLPPTSDSTENPVGTASLVPGGRRQVEHLFFRVTLLKTPIAGFSMTGSPSFGMSILPKPDPPHRSPAGDPSYARQAPL